MLKFYLSSYRMGDNPDLLSGLVTGLRRAAVIPPALDFSNDVERRKAGILRELTDLANIGLDGAVIIVSD